MGNKVFVVTSAEDAHADYICRKLVQKSIEFLRLNTDCVEEGIAEISIDGREQRISIHGNSICKNEFSSVWFRRPSVPEKQFKDRTVREYFEKEYLDYLDNLYLQFPNAYWVSSPSVLAQARKKVYQLSVAQHIGLRIPQTLISLEKAKVKAFASKCGSIVSKPFCVQILNANDGSDLSFGTRRVSDENLNSQSLYMCPSIFQERIEIDYEMRVVAIGKRLFAFGIKAKDGQKDDMKQYETDELDHFICTLDLELEAKVRAMLDYFKLPFSAMDFAVSKAGDIYFLEMNPNGQWLWLEILTGINMSDYFVDLLAFPHAPA